VEKVNDETQIIKYTVCRWIQAGGRWQEGQRSLLQMTVDDKFFKKYFLSSELNSGLLRIIFMFSSEKSSQVLGKLNKGCLSEEESLEKGIYKRSLFLRTWHLLQLSPLSSVPHHLPGPSACHHLLQIQQPLLQSSHLCCHVGLVATKL